MEAYHFLSYLLWSQRRLPSSQELFANSQIALLFPFFETKTIAAFSVSFCTSYFQDLW